MVPAKVNSTLNIFYRFKLKRCKDTVNNTYKDLLRLNACHPTKQISVAHEMRENESCKVLAE